MKASIKFRDEQKPLLRAKIPVSILNFPFQSSISASDSKDISLNLATSFDSGPSIKLSYRPNDSNNPFSFIFKTGVSHFGSPIKSPLTMSAEFNLIGNQSPRFFIHLNPTFGDFCFKKSNTSEFKPNFGDFSLKKSNSSDLLKKFNGGFMSGDNFVKGTEVAARTSIPLGGVAVVNFRWGLRVPAAAEGDMVVVGKSGENWMGGLRVPHLVMNKIGIEHLARGDSKKVGSGAKSGDVAEACLDLKKQVEVIRAENMLLNEVLKDLRSDIVEGKMDLFRDKQSSEVKGFGGKMVVREKIEGLNGV